MKKYYAGLDLASKKSSICIIDAEGRVVSESTLYMSEECLEDYFRKNNCERCIIEAAPLAESVVDRLSVVSSCKFIIVDPRDAKKAIKRGKKTDKLDAKALAQLCRTGWYQEVHKKSEGSRLLKSHLTARAQLQKTKRAVQSSIRGIFKAQGLNIPVTGNFYEEVSNILTKQEDLCSVINPLIEVLQVTEDQLSVSKNYLKKLSPEDKDCQLLMSHPGVGPIVSLAYKATIDDPSRFSSGEQVAAYLGLVPSIYQSGDTEYRGRITKSGDSHLRWLLVEAAHVILYRCKEDHPIRLWGLKLAEKKGFSKAKVAVARKLAVVLHRMWISNSGYNIKAAAV